MQPPFVPIPAACRCLNPAAAAIPLEIRPILSFDVGEVVETEKPPEPSELPTENGNIRNHEVRLRCPQPQPHRDKRTPTWSQEERRTLSARGRPELRRRPPPRWCPRRQRRRNPN
ncbi:unnamed protein product, partial [Laminaria digitata]